MGHKFSHPRPFLHHLAICVVLLGLTLAVYEQVRGFAFVEPDDRVYLLDHDRIWRGFTVENVHWAFTSSQPAALWQPLVWLSYMIDVELYGRNAAGFHLTNVALHACNVILVFAVFCAGTRQRWPSTFVAALWAVHPLHVESVAWVTERKDVLSTFFGLLAILAYIRSTRAAKSWRLLSLGAFAASLMSKQMLVTLPCLLLLFDYWPLKRWPSSSPSPTSTSFSRLVIEKIPFFLLTVLFSLVAVIAQRQGGALVPLEHVPFVYRCLNVVLVYGLYLQKTVWPVDLAVFYPHPGTVIVLEKIAMAAVVLGLVSVAAVWHRRTRPYLLVGWLWYLGSFVPVIGIVQVGSQQMADRFTYVPDIGLYFAVVWLIGSFVKARTIRSQNNTLVPAEADKGASALKGVPLTVTIIMVLVVAALVMAARRQASHWRNTSSLFDHAQRATGQSHIAHLFLGLDQQRKGNHDKAIEHFSKVLEIDPSQYEVQISWGASLFELGRIDQAIDQYQMVLDDVPSYGPAHNNMAVALNRQGRFVETQFHLQQALRLKPDLPNLQQALVQVRQQIERLQIQRRQLESQVEEKPDGLETRLKLAYTFRGLGDYESALTQLAQANRIDPSHPDLRAAIKVFCESLRNNPYHKEAGEKFKALLAVE